VGLVTCSQKGRCGIYGANCPEWFIAMEVRIYYATCFSYLPVYLLEKSALVQLSIHRLFWLIGALNGMKKKPLFIITWDVV
jgi:hypothetical protein